MSVKQIKFKTIAIDGPAGAGKTTVAKRIAEQLGYKYIDTGAMYRAMGLYLIRENVSATDKKAMSGKCENVTVDLRQIDGRQTVWMNDEDVTDLIRTEEVGKMASACGVNPDVRRKLVAQQREMAKHAPVIMEGRDIGTCVLPDADVKVYLTADAHVRAKRRYEELTAKGSVCDLAVIEKNIVARDHQDMTREISPLRQASDAILIDSSDMTIEEVVDQIISLN